MNIQIPEIQLSTPAWLQRIGLAGFLFFFLKGMVWLSLPLLTRLLLSLPT
jgi:hypothetical protein